MSNKHCCCCCREKESSWKPITDAPLGRHILTDKGPAFGRRTDYGHNFWYSIGELGESMSPITPTKWLDYIKN